MQYPTPTIASPAPEPTPVMTVPDEPQVDQVVEGLVQYIESVEEYKDSVESGHVPAGTSRRYAEYIRSAANEEGADPYLVTAIIYTESRFVHKTAPNSHGAIGLMQILRSNIVCNQRNAGCDQPLWSGYTIDDLKNPEKNIELGTKYLVYLIKRFGHDKGIIAYNQGESNVAAGKYRSWYLGKVNTAYESIGERSH